MNINELKPGDVLLLSGGRNSFISQAIMFLTDSPVSHAALSYFQSSEIIEETPPKIAKSSTQEKFKGREVYVMRYADKPMKPVMDAATQYLNEEEPYAMSELYLVGLILIYRKFTPGTLTQKVMIKILRKLTSGIIDFINNRKYPGKVPMVCSQFVYQCYKDGGYTLKIKDGVLLRAALPGQPVQKSVLEQVSESIKPGAPFSAEKAMAFGAPVPAVEEVKQSAEELAQELIEALEKGDDVAEELHPDFVKGAHEFSHAMYMHHATLSGEMTASVNFDAGLQFLKENEGYFVTPGDLLKHCKDLKQVGEIKIS